MPGHEYEHHTEPEYLSMVATLAQMASAEYYLESQRSYRHPNEYYTAGEEPDGTWFNPHGLFGLADGSRIDSKDFSRLYNGFAPDGSGKLNQNAGKDTRSPGLDMTFSVDKSVSALWAIAEPDMRAEIERLASRCGAGGIARHGVRTLQLYAGQERRQRCRHPGTG